MEEKKNYKVESVYLKNYKGIEEIELDLDCKSFIIWGSNGKGKTSVLAALEDLFTGEKVTKKQIKKGESKEELWAVVKEGASGAKYKIRRVVTEATSKLEITMPDDPHFKAAKPQSWINDILGEVNFDLDNLLNKSIEMQIKTFKEIIGVDTEKVDNALKFAEEKRKDNKKLLASEESRLDVLPHTFVEQYKVPQDSQSVRLKYDAYKEAENEIKSIDSAINATIENQAYTRKKIENYKILIKEEEAKLESIIENLKKGDEQKALFQKHIDENVSVVEQFNTITEYSNNHNKVVSYLKGKEAVKAIEAEVKLWDDRVEQARAGRAKILSSVEMPVEGLSFDPERGIIYNDIPLSEWNTAERIFVEAMIRMSRKDVSLKVIRIPEASLLDNENVARLTEMCERNGFQVAMEMVSRDPEDLRVEYIDETK